MSGWQLYAIVVFAGLILLLSWKTKAAGTVEQLVWGLVLAFIVIASCAVFSAYMPVS